MSRILIVITSHTALGDTGRPTGFHFEELATPYFAFRDAGHDIVLASIKGGPGAHDPGSFKADASARPASVQRFATDPVAMKALSATIRVDAVDAGDFDAVFLPGGHGTMWDFTDQALADLLAKAWDQGAVIGAVCHGPAGLVEVTKLDGTPLVAGLKANSFTDAEEEAIGLTAVVPFLLETRLREKGAIFECAANFQPHAVRDGRLVTGQNPRSVDRVSKLMLEALGDHRAQPTAA